MAENALTATITQNIVEATVVGTGTQGAKGEKGDIGPGSNIRVYTWVLDNPAVGGVPGPRVKEGHTVTSVESYVTQPTSVTFNIEKRSTVGVAGIDLLSSDQIADTDGTTSTTFATNSLATDDYLWLDISGVTGTPGKLTITLSATV